MQSEGADGGVRSGASSSQLQAYAARSLSLLRDIEQTVLALDTEVRSLNAFIDDAKRLHGILTNARVEQPLDPERRASELFQKAADTAQRVYEDAIRRCDAAVADERLTDDDCVVDAYHEFIAAVADYHNQLDALRELIETRDAIFGERGAKVYDNAEALLTDVLSGR